MPGSDFQGAFSQLTGALPFPWQQSLYDRFVAGRIPESCNLPTGLGKTSAIAVWLIALANGAPVPRRLVYVVNRRTVVDQTTDEVERYQRNLKRAGITEPLAISTLRGQFADNREWSADPSRPAVICGTVDMIGSRLLFSGYGCGFKTRPLHAGFLAQDSLLIHDEAHLEPAFQKLIEAIRDEQGRASDLRRLTVMELTATSRGNGDVFELTEDDRANNIVRRRIHASKTLNLIESHDRKKLAENIAQCAIEVGNRHGGSAILVYVRALEDVGRITKELPKDSWEQLTGTLRGLERDRLVKKPIFQRFLPESHRDGSVIPAEGTVYLVCTSAGEVGVNLSADHLVCDLTPFESMAQRFGRVNRFGDRDDSEIHVFHHFPRGESGSGGSRKRDNTESDVSDSDEPDDKDPLRIVRQNTLELLRQLEGDASPSALMSLDRDQRQAAFTPPPTILPTSEILFDAWSLTTIRDKLPGRPRVEPYLHGVAEWQPPETQVAWREEVGIVTGELPNAYPPADLLEDYPLKPHELLRDRSDRVFNHLKKRASKLDKNADRPDEIPVWLVDDAGSVQVTTLEKLIESGKESLFSRTVLLPPSAGGLEKGLLSDDSSTADDVADHLLDVSGNPRRARIWGDAEPPTGMRRIRTIDIKPDADDDSGERRFWHWYELPATADTEGSRTSRKPVGWQTHTDDVVSHTERIVERLLPESLRLAFRIAAECHDLGKKRRAFQTVLGNRDYPHQILAKSGRTGGRLDEHYRHEFGSLLDVRQCPGFDQLGPDEQELVLHLIAAHHGRARPHFPADEAFDPERPHDDAERMAAEVPRRFARLQRKYGRWGLAYLESLLRAADYAASGNPSQFLEGDTP